MKSFLFYLLLRFYRIFIKIKVKTYFDIENYTGSLIFAFWHEIILFLPFAAPRKREIDILISTHKDGRFAADIIKHFNLGNVGGSSNKEPKKAFLKMLKRIKNGKDIGITPDGPKGPRRKMKKGVAQLAYMSKYPIVPIALNASNAWRVGSWDRMIIPKPFSTLTFYFFEPIFITDKNEMDKKSKIIEDKLNEF